MKFNAIITNAKSGETIDYSFNAKDQEAADVFAEKMVSDGFTVVAQLIDENGNFEFEDEDYLQDVSDREIAEG